MMPIYFCVDFLKLILEWTERSVCHQEIHGGGMSVQQNNPNLSIDVFCMLYIVIVCTFANSTQPDFSTDSVLCCVGLCDIIGRDPRSPWYWSTCCVAGTVTTGHLYSCVHSSVMGVDFSLLVQWTGLCCMAALSGLFGFTFCFAVWGFPAVHVLSLLASSDFIIISYGVRSIAVCLQ